MEVPLAAYTDKLSARPGETIKFHVSSILKPTSAEKNEVVATLHRSICVDPNPNGPQIKRQRVPTELFAPTRFQARHQPILNGSCAMSKGNIALPATAKSFQVNAWVYPTVIPYPDCRQFIWTWGELSMFLDENGCIVVGFPTTTGDHPAPIMSTAKPLEPNRWYHLMLAIDANDSCHLTVSAMTKQTSAYRYAQQKQHQHQHPCEHPHRHHRNIIHDVKSFVPLESLRPIEGLFWLSMGGTFNGKVEAPQIIINEDNVFASWDMSQDIPKWIVPVSKECDTTSIPPLVLYNYPTRGVRGRLWDGTEYNWKHRPDHYAAVYFHDDDCYDFGWESDFQWTVPSNMPSGVYLMLLQNAEKHDECLPIFICAPLQPMPQSPRLQRTTKRKNKICILFSTFTYVMYGNHARADFEESWLERTKTWNCYPHNPILYPEYGWSTYNFHTDGTGICFASHRRPLFNMRPQFYTFGKSTCSGLRHFPADSHLTAWMHHHGLEYDIVTDHDLHKYGLAALAGYSTLITGTHPEYHSLQTLDALQAYRDDLAGNIIYLGGNGFYWRVAAQDEDASLLEIRRAEGGVRTWASEPGEYYHAIDGGSYGGLWRRNNRPPQQLVGVGFSAQGPFQGMPYKRTCYDPDYDWIFTGLEGEEILGDFGYSGGGAAGFELDRIDRQLDGADFDIVLVAQAVAATDSFMLVPEEVLTTSTNTAGILQETARRSDMIYFETAAGGQVFSVGSITFCGCLPWNGFNNNISKLLFNIVGKFTSRDTDASRTFPGQPRLGSTSEEDDPGGTTSWFDDYKSSNQGLSSDDGAATKNSDDTDYYFEEIVEEIVEIHDGNMITRLAKSTKPWSGDADYLKSGTSTKPRKTRLHEAESQDGKNTPSGHNGEEVDLNDCEVESRDRHNSDVESSVSDSNNSQIDETESDEDDTDTNVDETEHTSTGADNENENVSCSSVQISVSSSDESGTENTS